MIIKFIYHINAHLGAREYHLAMIINRKFHNLIDFIDSFHLTYWHMAHETVLFVQILNVQWSLSTTIRWNTWIHLVTQRYQSETASLSHSLVPWSHHPNVQKKKTYGKTLSSTTTTNFGRKYIWTSTYLIRKRTNKRK